MKSLASRLTERVTILQPLTSDDGYGGLAVDWEELTTVFAEVTPILSVVQDRLVADARRATNGYRITIRTRSDVTGAMRLQWKSHALSIHSLHEQDTVLSILAYEDQV